MSPFCATDVQTWASGSPKRVVSVRGGNVRRASRQRAARARGVAPRRGASIAPSWPGAPCVLGAAELATHPWSRPSSMPANHAGYSRRTRRGGAARAMARHAGYRRSSAPHNTELVSRVAGLRKGTRQRQGGHRHAAWLHRRREVKSSSDAVHYVLPPCA